MSPAEPTKLVVLIDDMPATTLLLSRLIEALGWSTAAFTSAADALVQLEHLAPRLLITDLRMPGMDGFEFLRRLRAEQPQHAAIPVVPLTGADDEAVREQMREAGFAEPLVKPVSVAVLRELLTRIDPSATTH